MLFRWIVEHKKTEYDDAILKNITFQASRPSYNKIYTNKLRNDETGRCTKWNLTTSSTQRAEKWAINSSDHQNLRAIQQVQVCRDANDGTSGWATSGVWRVYFMRYWTFGAWC